ncbi:TetR/AcrR family transcriptional regulator [Ktedonobacter racemifer]|uniref:Transcriptional regulator, TetR family n=1 Tax=Ktedonobacter racemifer DSM 44963 TaxID=485913 RepID=D6U093_KTERA|nr:TetR/AcrR family transcriptional regulator [Ktedonobacter racemifer]EFH82233.1 transcriptional regulator, TetR family [Ktedonobacter racemifer DSM 44963]
MTQKREAATGPAELSKQQLRAERILDAAGELLLRWGYKRLTIDDIARQAEVGSGTIYLHWKTREALFETLMLRECIAIWRELQQRMLADPEEALLHRMMRAMLLIVMSRPLARAFFVGDRDLLGKMAQSEVSRQMGKIAPSQDFIRLLCDLGLMRTDMEITSLVYAFSATITGFCLVDPLLTEDEQIALEVKGDALARVVQLAFAPELEPSHATLRTTVVPTVSQLLEQVCAYCEQQIQERML